MRPVHVVGVGSTIFGCHLDRSLRSLGREAILQALSDAGAERDLIEAGYCGNALGSTLQGETGVGQNALWAAGIAGIPIVNVENACASGSTALHLGWQAIASGQYEARTSSNSPQSPLRLTRSRMNCLVCSSPISAIGPSWWATIRQSRIARFSRCSKRVGYDSGYRSVRNMRASMPGTLGSPYVPAPPIEPICDVEAPTMWDSASAFSTKQDIRIDEQQTGYAPMESSEIKYGDAVVNGRYKPDLSEALWIRRELPVDDPGILAGRRFRRNKWPSGLPGFREIVLRYMATMEALGARILPLYALALDLPFDYFDRLFDRADTPCRFGHYPSHRGGADHFGAAPHTDAGFIRLLPQAREPGLEILTRSKRWIPAPVRPGEILVNGDNLPEALHQWSLSRDTASRRRRAAPRPLFDPAVLQPEFRRDRRAGPDMHASRESRPLRTITYEDYIIADAGAYFEAFLTSGPPSRADAI